jgi:hypothetical protein
MPVFSTNRISVSAARSDTRLFSNRVWAQAQVLLAGARRCPATRTVTCAVRVMGWRDEKQFRNYHRVLSRARWSSLSASRILLSLLVAALVPDGVVLVGIDETIERGRGEKIKAKGISHDPVRSSQLHVGVDEATAEIRAAVVTTNNFGDGQLLADLLEQVESELSQVTGDGGYDDRQCYDAIRVRGARA